MRPRPQTSTPAQFTVFERARAYVSKIPGAIEGNQGDSQTLAVANVLVWDFAMSPSEALDILREYNARCLPPWSEPDLVRKLHSAEKQSHAKPRGCLLRNEESHFRPPQRSPTVFAKPGPSTAVENFLKGFRCTACDLVAASSCRIPPLICGEHFHRQGAYLIDQLFEPGELVNIVTKSIVAKGKARPVDTGLTLERNEWEERLLKPWASDPGGAWLRMNPLDGRGVADANVTSFRFALIECDEVPLPLQLSLLAKLPLPVAAILTSGGRSAHAWVRVNAETFEDYRQTVCRMLALLGKFGVDGKNKNPSRLSRLPGVQRIIGADGDGRQRLLYLNPQPAQKAIL